MGIGGRKGRGEGIERRERRDAGGGMGGGREKEREKERAQGKNEGRK